MNNTIETAKKFLQENYKNGMYENYSVMDIQNNTISYHFRFFNNEIYDTLIGYANSVIGDNKQIVNEIQKKKKELFELEFKIKQIKEILA